MNILIAGGSGFVGRALAASLAADHHQVYILTRRAPVSAAQIQWDGQSLGSWVGRVDAMDVIINLTGFSLAHWPWSAANKTRFLASRRLPGLALASALAAAAHRPEAFIQASGINYYGLRGEAAADETTRAGSDFLAQLTVQWEAATESIESLGVRRLILRQAVVLGRRGGMFPIMALPVQLFAGGPIGNGRQAVPWIHLSDLIGGIRFLMQDPRANGVYNLIAPEPTSNAEFMRAVAQVLHRPYWLSMPSWAMHAVLGEMAVLITEGRYVRPTRLLELGYPFQFPSLPAALADLVR